MTRNAKWLILGTLGATALAASFMLLPRKAQGVISGSQHDFSSNGWAQNEICKPCHTPHFANMTVPDAPLWNHSVTTATFTPYSSPTLNANMGTGQPSGISKLCLSCHDGTVALDSYGGTTGGTSGMISGMGLIGTDLRDDHPISFTYDAALVTSDTMGGVAGLWDPTTKVVPDLNSETVDQVLLINHKVECSSCHDVHNKYNQSKLVKITNVGSKLCLTCHNK